MYRLQTQYGRAAISRNEDNTYWIVFGIFARKGWRHQDLKRFWTEPAVQTDDPKTYALDILVANETET